MNSTNVSSHNYCSNYIFLHNFKLPNVNDFWILLAKILYFSILYNHFSKYYTSNYLFYGTFH